MKNVATYSLVGLICLATAIASAQEKKAPRKRAAAKPERTLALPENVTVQKDIIFAQTGTNQLGLDLYLPKDKPAAPLPCIVVIHGGGWSSGDKERFAKHAAYLASKGFAAVSIDYRLMPAVQILDCVQDCKAAVRWVRANAAKYGFNPDKIGTIGGSAGGHLVAILGTSYKAEKLEGAAGNPGISSRVQAVVAMAAVTDFLGMRSERLKIDMETAKLLSPVTYVDQDSAPLLLLHGEADKLVPMSQSEALLAKYQAAGVPATLVKNKGGHGFWNQDPSFTESMDQAVAFFREKLK